MAILVAGLFFAVVLTQKSNASAQGSSHSIVANGTLSWTGKGSDACAPGTTGNVLWIFNPHSGAVPVSLTVTWSTGVTVIYTGWKQSGQGQDWHLTVDIVGVFPPQSASVSYTGVLGQSPVLTISGCNESTTTTTTAPTTTTSPTTTGATTTTGTTTNGTTTVVATVTQPSTTVTNTVTGPAQTVTSPTQTVTVTQTGPTQTVTNTVTIVKKGKTKVIVKKVVVVHVKKVKVQAKKHLAYTP